MANGKENVIATKSLAFALRIINLYKYLVGKNEIVLARQILRSGTSIGANCREARNAQSRLDFISKLNIALKEADETAYWLELLKEGDFIDQQSYESIFNDCDELVKLLTSIIKSNKKKMNIDIY
jgi:four helix bundle protein